MEIPILLVLHCGTVKNSIAKDQTPKLDGRKIEGVCKKVVGGSHADLKQVEHIGTSRIYTAYQY